jgi:hypothetical protein
MANMFQGCSSLRTAALRGTKVTVAYAPPAGTLPVASLESIFDNLGSPAAATYINVTGNIGSVTPTTPAVTFTDAGDVVGLAGHPYQNGDSVMFATIVTTTGIAINTPYFVVGRAADTFQVSLTVGGAAIALVTNGTGTIYQPVTQSVDTTAGSNIVAAAATAGFVVGQEVTGAGITTALACTIEPAADTITIVGHGIPDGTPVSLATLVTSTGIAVNTIYYVRDTAANTLKLALTAGGAAIDITGADGSGTLRLRQLITAIDPNVSVTLSAKCSATATVTMTATALMRWKASLKNWVVSV